MNLFFNVEENRLRAGWRLLIQFIVFFFIAGLATLLIRLLVPLQTSLYTAIGSLIGVIASIWLAATMLDKRPVLSYGLTVNKQWVKDFMVGICFGSFAMCSIFILEWQLNWIAITGWYQTTLPYPFFLALLSSLLAMLIVGIYEESLSRGYQILNLSEGLYHSKIGTTGTAIAAVILSSTFFALMHAFNPNVTEIAILNIIFAGVVLAVPYLLTGQLGLSIGLHFSWNFVQGSIFGFPVSGTHMDATVIQITQYGPDIWTGGSFGPEAGITGIIGMAIMLGATFVYLYSIEHKLRLAAPFKNEP